MLETLTKELDKVKDNTSIAKELFSLELGKGTKKFKGN